MSSLIYREVAQATSFVLYEFNLDFESIIIRLK